MEEYREAERKTEDQNRADDITYSVVIPVYNSGAWIKELVLRIEEVMEEENGSYEIVLVNDGSPQKETWPAIRKMVSHVPHVKAIDLRYNAGQFNALMCGFHYACGEYVITMDDDFQHDPGEIPKLIRKMQETDCDCVIGNYEHREHNLFRRAGSSFVNFLLTRVYGKPKDIRSTSFRILKREVVDTLLLSKGKKPQIGWMIFSVTKNVAAVPITHQKRTRGKSGYDMRHLVQATMDIIINGSTFPLDFISIVGVAVACVAFVITIVYLIFYFTGRILVPGYASLILAVSFFSGVILFGIGMLGRYIGRLIGENVGFPAYAEKEVISSEDAGNEDAP